jgi:hypothetical protein
LWPSISLYVTVVLLRLISAADLSIEAKLNKRKNPSENT